jgi:hypothetical protein
MELSVVETVQQMACDMKLFACNRKPNQAAVRVATALASLIALVAASDLSLAAKVRPDQSVAVRPGGEPIMAIVSLHDQQITVYDDKGLIMRAPVSSGQKGPARRAAARIPCIAWLHPATLQLCRAPLWHNQGRHARDRRAQRRRACLD